MEEIQFSNMFCKITWYLKHFLNQCLKVREELIKISFLILWKISSQEVWGQQGFHSCLV